MVRMSARDRTLSSPQAFTIDNIEASGSEPAWRDLYSVEQSITRPMVRATAER
jgi:hypothetical protein